MSIKTRTTRVALSAVCLSGLLGAAGVLSPGPAAAETLQCASSIAGSGSSLQAAAQEKVFTVKFASTLCATAPSVKYTKTSSGPALSEFGNETGALEPVQSLPNQTGTTLDGYVGSDDPPTPRQVNTADAAAGGGDQAELTIPVAEAPVALLLHPPASCTVSGTPDVPNTVLDELWQDGYASWDAFLTAAGTAHSGTCTAAPTLIVRKDNSGTSYVFKSYLNQVDTAVWQGVANDFVAWPDPVTDAASTGGGGEVASVAATEGAVGYAAAADAHSGGVVPWTSGAPLFWGEIQNNGLNPAGATYADPASGKNGNCPTAVTPLGTPTTPGNWYGVLASNPSISTTTGFVAGQYSLCGLTYDLAWADYAKIGNLGKSEEYGGTSTTAQQIGHAVADYLTYVTGQGQADLASAENYYSGLPTAVKSVAAETATEIDSAGGGSGGGSTGNTGGTGSTGTTTTTTTTTTTAASTSAAVSVTPPNVTATAASVVQGNHVSVTVSCPAGATTCAGSVSVKTASAIAASASKKAKHKVAPFVVGKQSFTLQGGQSKTITVSLNSKAAALLRQHGSLPVIATVTVTGGHTVTEHVVLKLKKVKKAKKH